MRHAHATVLPPTHVKRERFVACWRWGYDEVPDYVDWHVHYIEAKGHYSITSPASGHASIFHIGDWIIQTDVGCFYTVKDADFRKKYRPIDADDDPGVLRVRITHKETA